MDDNNGYSKTPYWTFLHHDTSQEPDSSETFRLETLRMVVGGLDGIGRDRPFGCPNLDSHTPREDSLIVVPRKVYHYNDDAFLT